MSRPLRIARVTVTSWPTKDGLPWDVWTENTGSEWNEWLEALPREITDEFVVHEDSLAPSPIVAGWHLPNPNRRHYLSPGAARRWAGAARRLGAVVDVEMSDPVVWSARPEPKPEEPAQRSRRVETVELPEPAQTDPF